MGINFPNAPAVGELHPTPPQAGVPQYRWDGTAWVAQSQDQLAFVKRTGDTMSGALTLPADPAAALQAATKQYVDAKSSLYISDNPPVSPPDGSMWWDSDNGLLYIRYNDGAGPSQWVQAVATPAIDASVFVNKAGDTMGGALTLPGDPVAALQAAPKQYVDAVRAYAAPYDAMAYSGMQINGGMEVSQERGSAGFSIGAQDVYQYVVDGWKVATHTTSGTVGCGQAVGGSIGGGYFPYVLSIGGAAGVWSGAGDYIMLTHCIEGYRVAKLGWGTASALPITVSFWINSAVTGHASVSIRNASNARSYVADVVINAVSTWEYKTVTIPGDTTGTWAKDNTTGINLTFTLAAGSTFRTAANTWTAGNLFATTLQTNLNPTSPNYIYITGVVVLPGTQAPTAAQSPTIMRPYDQELRTCQRYFQFAEMNMRCSFPAGNQVMSSGLSIVSKRAPATIILTAVGTISPNCASATVVHDQLDFLSMGILNTATAGDCYALQRMYSVDARL